MNNPAQFFASQLLAIAVGLTVFGGTASIVPYRTAFAAAVVAWMAFAQLAFIEDVLRGIEYGS